MRNRNSELWYASLTVILITVAYTLTVTRGGAPPSSSMIGYLFGVVGFLLMLMTGTLYAVQKRFRLLRQGSMAFWLKFHIFTGFVGPYMVLMHTAWNFKGLAGVVTIMASVVVLSGLIGRYIYTAVPRTTSGAEMASEDLEPRLASVQAGLYSWLAAGSEINHVLPRHMIDFSGKPKNTWLLAFGRLFLECGYKWQWWCDKHRLKSLTRKQAKELGCLLQRQRELCYQTASLAVTKQVLALWHSVHIFITVTFFTTAVIHIGAAIYYASLGK